MTEKAISPLRRRLIEDMEIRRLSPKTQYQFNGQAARLAGRDELLGKIVAFQCDLEEEPQGRSQQRAY